MKKLVIIDGNSIMNRAFYGLSGKNMLMTKDGIHTNAVFGFLTILFKILHEDQPDYLAVAFDLKAPTFRHKMYDGYKANRRKMPDELAEQMPIIKDVLDAMNIKRVEIEGYEADDILGTLSKKAKEQGEEVILFTGDRDSFQLIEENIIVKLPVTKGGHTETEVYDVEGIYEKYGVSPLNLIDVKGLMGDTSDNIPGVPGIGEKTALGYIKAYGNIENVYEHIDDALIKPKARESLTDNKELAFMSRTLATIDRDIPVEFTASEFEVREVNSEALYDIFNKLEFTTFIKKMNLTSSSVLKSDFLQESGEKISDIETLKQVLENIEEFAFFTDEDFSQIGVYSNKNAFCLNLNSSDELLKVLFENDKRKYGMNTKNTYIELKHRGIQLNNLVFDLDIAQYVVNPTRVDGSIDKIAEDKLFFNLASIREVAETQISLFNVVTKVDNNKYLTTAAKVIWTLMPEYMQEIKANKQEQLFNEIEMPLIEVLADMQIAGMKVDTNFLHAYGNELSEKLEELQSEIIKLAGVDFNVNSPKQIGEVLFEKLGLNAGKRNKKGYVTDAETLEKIKNDHPIVEKILEYKQYAKLKSTYIDGIENVMNESTGKVHSNFNQTITATGRLSSTEPNLQNIPIKMELGRKIRKMFVPESDFVFIDADYSQIELRVLAHMADEKTMLEAFNCDEDIHSATAMQIFHVSKDEVTSQLRSRAKTVNFGIVYGQGDFSLSQDLGISKKEAKEYIDSYFEHFSGIKTFMNSKIEQAKKQGFVDTIFNRRRYLPEIKSSNFNIRSFGERIAMNMPIQGSAADIIKIAMIEVHRKLKGMKSRLVLQVHDELLVETAKDEIEAVKSIVRESMENAVKLSVRLKVELQVGENWYDAK